MYKRQCKLGVRCWEAVLLLTLASAGAYACAPPPIYSNKEQRIRAQVREADKVFIATIVRADRRPRGQPTERQTESLVFRIDEVYKGKLRAGERYHTVTSGFGASCGVSAWPGTPFGPDNPIRDKDAVIKRWLVFSDANRPGELTAPSVPLDKALIELRLVRHAVGKK